MNITKTVSKLLEKRGQDVKVVLRYDEYNIKAFIQLMRYKNKMYIDLPMGEIGRRDNGCYLYIGPPEPDFTECWTTTDVYFNGYTYGVKRAQMIYCDGKPFYIWAVLYRIVKDGEYERA